MISKLRIIWAILCLAMSIIIGVSAFETPSYFVGLIDLVATIISILIGISLALTSVLSSRPVVSDVHFSSLDEKLRVEEVLATEDSWLIEGQHLLFWLYYIALILALVAKWHVGIPLAEASEMCRRIIMCCFIFFSTGSFLMSANLPALFKQVSNQRKSLQ